MSFRKGTPLGNEPATESLVTLHESERFRERGFIALAHQSTLAVHQEFAVKAAMLGGKHRHAQGKGFHNDVRRAFAARCHRMNENIDLGVEVLDHAIVRYLRAAALAGEEHPGPHPLDGSLCNRTPLDLRLSRGFQACSKTHRERRMVVALAPRGMPLLEIERVRNEVNVLVGSERPEVQLRAQCNDRVELGKGPTHRLQVVPVQPVERAGSANTQNGFARLDGIALRNERIEVDGHVRGSLGGNDVLVVAEPSRQPLGIVAVGPADIVGWPNDPVDGLRRNGDSLADFSANDQLGRTHRGGRPQGSSDNGPGRRRARRSHLGGVQTLEHDLHHLGQSPYLRRGHIHGAGQLLDRSTQFLDFLAVCLITGRR